MPTKPVASATWQQVAALRLDRHHLTKRAGPDDLWRFVAAWPVRDTTRSPAWLWVDREGASRLDGGPTLTMRPAASHIVPTGPTARGGHAP